jgi:Fe-S-cluster containining protein
MPTSSSARALVGRDSIQALYDKLPAFQCKGLCQQYCGVVPFSKSEAAKVGKAEAFLTDLHCEYLSPFNTCTVYENRPMVCRLFGMVDDSLMKCQHCAPVLTKQEGQAIIQEYHQLISKEAR